MLASITVNVTPNTIYAALAGCAVLSLPLIIYKIKAAYRRTEERKKRERTEKDLRERTEKDLERGRLEQLLPHPWKEAYDECFKYEAHQTRAKFLECWIEQQINLPKLSFEAINALAVVVGKSKSDADYQNACDQLKPFLVKPKNQVIPDSPKRELSNVPSNYYFAQLPEDDEDDPGAFLIVKKDYWQYNHYLEDRHIAADLHLPLFYEVQESVFEYRSPYNSVDSPTEGRNQLLALGFTENHELLP